MSRKKDKKAPPTKPSPSLRNHPSMAWLPAFFAGLVLGLFIHFIPGMEPLLDNAHQSQRPDTTSVAEERPVMWRPHRTNYPPR